MLGHLLGSAIGFALVDVIGQTYELFPNLGLHQALADELVAQIYPQLPKLIGRQHGVRQQTVLIQRLLLFFQVYEFEKFVLEEFELGESDHLLGVKPQAE